MKFKKCWDTIFEMNNMEAIPRGVIWDASKVVVGEYIYLTGSLKKNRDQNRYMFEKEIRKMRSTSWLYKKKSQMAFPENYFMAKY